MNHLGSEFDRYQSLVQLFDHKSSSIFNFKLYPDKDMLGFWHSLKDPFCIKLKKLDLKFWSTNYTLHRLDRLTMANSLEARVPYFNHSLVEFMLKLKSSKQFNFYKTKNFFRTSIPRDLLPKEIINRRKMPFFLPTEIFFSPDHINKMIQEIISNAPKRGIYNIKVLEEWVKFEQGITMVDAKRLQALYNLELWYQVFIDPLSM